MRKSTALDLVKNSNFSGFSLNTHKFLLAGFKKPIRHNKEITIYIEGDGLAWLDRFTVSGNPTPLDPLALKLALLDEEVNVIYLARPCQYVDLENERNCSSRYWTSHRFSKEVVSSFNEALDILKTMYKVTGFHLVGFSGGGAIAALLAMRRNDIKSLRTVAGNLDHVALAKAHDATPLSGSLNPITEALKIENIPQIHFSGSNDVVVPPWVASSFVNAIESKKCAKVIVVPNTEHLVGWVLQWRNFSFMEPVCQK